MPCLTYWLVDGATAIEIAILNFFRSKLFGLFKIGFFK